MRIAAMRILPDVGQSSALIGSVTIPGAISASGWYSVAEPVTISGSKTITAIDFTWLASNVPSGTAKIGLASALGASDTNVSWLGGTPATQTIQSADGTFTFPINPTAVTSGSYYIVMQAITTSTGYPGLGLAGNNSNAVSGIITGVSTLQYTGSVGGTWTSNTYYFATGLRGY